MTAYDKIRVLWIDDREEMDGTPEGEITPPDYQEWFRIVHPGSEGDPMSIRSASEFAPVIRSFWFEGDDSILPAEIIATDYNLSKRAGVAVAEQTAKEMEKDLLDTSGDDDGDAAPRTSSPSPTGRSVNFEGLLISLFYGTLAYQHPTAIVPMTRYLGRMPAEVGTLHALVEPFLGIDFQFIGLEDRRWNSILQEGVKHLRQRIGELFRQGDITLSPSDLMAMSESSDHTVLTLHSPHAVRRLPIQGLFIDVRQTERSNAIRHWAEELMGEVMGGCRELRQAQELAGQIWKTYNKGKLVEERKQLSLLALRKEAGRNFDEAEYDRLCEDFGVVKKKVKDGYVDITSTGEYSHRVRRWATLLVTLEMLKALILMKKRVSNLRADEFAGMHLEGPILTTDDLFLALFPVAASPLILPWHSGTNLDSASGWVKTMMRWKDQQEVGTNRGDLALDVRDVLAGEGWDEDGPFGLTNSERLIIRGFALENESLGESDWRMCIQAQLVLWGKLEGRAHE